MNICMIGAGDAGLVPPPVFRFRLERHLRRERRGKLERLGQGETPIDGPASRVLVGEECARRRLHFTGGLAAAAAGADLIFLAVGTPMPAATAMPTFLTYIKRFEEIAPHLTGLRWSPTNPLCRWARAAR